MHQKVMVTVLEVDIPRKRISLSLKKDPEKAGAQTIKQKQEEKRPGLADLQKAFSRNRT